MKLPLIASLATAALLATAAHAQPPAPQKAGKAMVPDSVGTVTGKVFVYSLAPGADSDAMTPPPGVPVLVTASQRTADQQGVAQVVMYRVNNAFLEWTGLNSTNNSTIAEGYNNAHGTHVVWIDYAQLVDIEVNDANTFFVHNGSTATRTGRIELFY